MKQSEKYGFLKKICESLIFSYGKTLVENGTDFQMAERLLRDLKPFLGNLPERHRMTRAEFISWRMGLLADMFALDAKDLKKLDNYDMWGSDEGLKV